MQPSFSAKKLLHVVEYAPSHSRSRGSCTLSSQLGHRIWTQLISQVFESYGTHDLNSHCSEDKPWPLDLRGAQCTSGLQCLRLLDTRARSSSAIGPWFGVEETVQQVDNWPAK